MTTKINRLLIVLVLIFSCQGKEKKETTNTINSLFTDGHGNKISKAELAKSTEVFNYDKVYFKKNDASELAKSFYEQGKKYQEEGNTKKAIEEFKKAHKEAPNWIYPIYNLAIQYVFQDTNKDALKYYALANKIAPKGFYDTKIALHALQREKIGDLKIGTYKNYLLFELSRTCIVTAEVNRSLCKTSINELLKEVSNFAPLWKDYALFLESYQEKLNAIEKGLSQNPDAKTKGILLLNKAIFTSQNGDLEKATKILASIIFNPDSEISNIEMAKYFLNEITSDI